MHDAWVSSIGKSIIHRSVIAAHHSQASRRIEMVQGDYEFVVVNYDGLNLIANEVVANGKFDLVIVDEANAYKNPSTQRWKSLNKILKPDTMLWMMTGTPCRTVARRCVWLSQASKPPRRTQVCYGMA
jgi:SNF2 family DNA or RNA helicase